MPAHTCSLRPKKSFDFLPDFFAFSSLPRHLSRMSARSLHSASIRVADMGDGRSGRAARGGNELFSEERAWSARRQAFCRKGSQSFLRSREMGVSRRKIQKNDIKSKPKIGFQDLHLNPPEKFGQPGCIPNSFDCTAAVVLFMFNLFCRMRACGAPAC
jgi:hypothetical protein